MMMRCSERGHLLGAAERCEQAGAKFADGSAEHTRAREVLAGMAAHCRRAARVFDLDPTLATEPADTCRFRALDLLTELARQVKPLLMQACYREPASRTLLPPKQDQWDEVEALFTRAGEIASAIVDVVPRLDHATVTGARAISRERLAARAHHLSEAAGEIRHACDVQDGLQVADPLIDYLRAMVEQIEHHADVLTAEREATVATLAAAAHLPA